MEKTNENTEFHLWDSITMEVGDIKGTIKFYYLRPITILVEVSDELINSVLHYGCLIHGNIWAAKTESFALDGFLNSGKAAEIPIKKKYTRFPLDVERLLKNNINTIEFIIITADNQYAKYRKSLNGTLSLRELIDPISVFQTRIPFQVMPFSTTVDKQSVVFSKTLSTTENSRTHIPFIVILSNDNKMVTFGAFYSERIDLNVHIWSNNNVNINSDISLECERLRNGWIYYTKVAINIEIPFGCLLFANNRNSWFRDSGKDIIIGNNQNVEDISFLTWIIDAETDSKSCSLLQRADLTNFILSPIESNNLEITMTSFFDSILVNNLCNDLSDKDDKDLSSLQLYSDNQKREDLELNFKNQITPLGYRTGVILHIWWKYSISGLLNRFPNYSESISNLSIVFKNCIQNISLVYICCPFLRPFAKKLLSYVGNNDSDALAIRENILHIMHKYELTNNINTDFYEQWFQKLYNNSTKDDIAICRALIKYLKKIDDSEYEANISFINELKNHNLSFDDLKSIDRAIYMLPYKPQDIDISSFINSWEYFLCILLKSHDITDICKIIISVKNILDSKLVDDIEYISSEINTKKLSKLKILKTRKALLDFIHEKYNITNDLNGTWLFEHGWKLRNKNTYNISNINISNKHISDLIQLWYNHYKNTDSSDYMLPLITTYNPTCLEELGKLLQLDQSLELIQENCVDFSFESPLESLQLVSDFIITFEGIKFNTSLSDVLLDDISCLNRDWHQLETWSHSLYLQALTNKLYIITSKSLTEIHSSYYYWSRRIFELCNLDTDKSNDYAESCVKDFSTLKMANELKGYIYHTTASFSRLNKYEIISSGFATGMLLNINSLKINQSYNNMILIVDNIDSNRNPPKGICGLILTKSISIFSNLFVKLNEENIPSWVINDKLLLEEITHYIGKVIKIIERPEKLKVFEIPLYKPQNNNSDRNSCIDLYLDCENYLKNTYHDNESNLNLEVQSKCSEFMLPSDELLNSPLLRNLGTKIILEKYFDLYKDKLGNKSKYLSKLSKIVDIPPMAVILSGVLGNELEYHNLTDFVIEKLKEALQYMNLDKLEEIKKSIYMCSASPQLLKSISDLCQSWEISTNGVAEAIYSVLSSVFSKNIWNTLSLTNLKLPGELEMCILLQPLIQPSWSFVVYNENINKFKGLKQDFNSNHISGGLQFRNINNVTVIEQFPINLFYMNTSKGIMVRSDSSINHNTYISSSLFNSKTSSLVFKSDMSLYSLSKQLENDKIFPILDNIAMMCHKCCNFFEGEQQIEGIVLQCGKVVILRSRNL